MLVKLPRILQRKSLLNKNKKGISAALGITSIMQISPCECMLKEAIHHIIRH